MLWKIVKQQTWCRVIIEGWWWSCFQYPSYVLVYLSAIFTFKAYGNVYTWWCCGRDDMEIQDRVAATSSILTEIRAMEQRRFMMTRTLNCDHLITCCCFHAILDRHWNSAHLSNLITKPLDRLCRPTSLPTKLIDLDPSTAYQEIDSWHRNSQRPPPSPSPWPEDLLVYFPVSKTGA